MPNCTLESILIPSSLTKFAHAPMFSLKKTASSLVSHNPWEALSYVQYIRKSCKKRGNSKAFSLPYKTPSVHKFYNHCNLRLCKSERLPNISSSALEDMLPPLPLSASLSLESSDSDIRVPTVWLFPSITGSGLIAGLGR